MKFKDFKYIRPDYNKYKLEFMNIVKQIEKSSSSKNQIENIQKLNKIRNNIESMATITSIRYSIDTSDKSYEKEKQYWDEYLPLFEELNSSFYKAIINSKFKDEIGNYYGKQFLKICEFSIKSFSSDIIKDLQEENKLCSRYTKLLASANIKFKGEEYNLSGLMKFMIDPNREIRKLSSELYYKYFEENENEFDDIFDQLVKLRDTMAKKLGFKNFVELGYIKMMRTDYNSLDVVKFREQVKNDIVPLAMELYKRQGERIEIDTLSYIDENFEYKTGNASLCISSEEIIENGKIMYEALSKDTKEFFDFMLENELMDLKTKKSKAAGGYCTYIPDYKSPFIFSNFNQTSEDIDVLTHEAGHAFQLYMSRHIDMPEINFPTLDSCEIHSMSMEFITWPWMDLFFKENTDKYKFSHMSSAIKFIPYGIVVDEFQHIVYENPTMSIEERKSEWRELERKYLPHKNYKGNEFLERGGWWFKQGHIFKNPFYYIDYTLAQICALQFWAKSRENKNSMWNDYLNICKLGGTKSFLEIIDIGNLNSPFKPGCITDVTQEIRQWLCNINDKNI